MLIFIYFIVQLFYNIWLLLSLLLLLLLYSNLFGFCDNDRDDDHHQSASLISDCVYVAAVWKEAMF